MQSTSRSLRIASCAAAVMTVMFSVPDQAAAQRDRESAGSRPGWLPRINRLGSTFTAAQKATAIANLEAIERILLQVPELARPEGFEIETVLLGGSRRLGPGDSEQPGWVTEYQLRLGFYFPSKAIAGEGCACVNIEINRASDFGTGAALDERGHQIYVEMPRGDPIPLATQVYDRLTPNEKSHVWVLLTSGGELPWRTVSREQFYKAVIYDTEVRQGADLENFRSALTRTPYQEWMANAEERRLNREETLRSAAALRTPAEVAELRKLLEDTEREVAANLKASEAVDRETNQAGLAASHGRTNSVRAELNAMSDAERSMPALVDMVLSDGPIATGWRLTQEDAPNVWRVLTPNYDFWRARRSPVEVRSIVVQIGASGTGLGPVVNHALMQTFRKLDWAALNKLLAVPR